MQELPETSSGIAQWCKDVFVAKVIIIYIDNQKLTCLKLNIRLKDSL